MFVFVKVEDDAAEPESTHVTKLYPLLAVAVMLWVVVTPTLAVVPQSLLVDANFSEPKPVGLAVTVMVDLTSEKLACTIAEVPAVTVTVVLALLELAIVAVPVSTDQ